jgi:hypothetical protein
VEGRIQLLDILRRVASHLRDARNEPLAASTISAGSFEIVWRRLSVLFFRADEER